MNPRAGSRSVNTSPKRKRETSLACASGWCAAESPTGNRWKRRRKNTDHHRAFSRAEVARLVASTGQDQNGHQEPPSYE